MDSIANQLFTEVKERKSQLTLSFIIAFVLMHWRIILESLDLQINMNTRIEVLEKLAAQSFWSIVLLPLLYAFLLVLSFLVLNTGARFMVYGVNEVIWPKIKKWLSKFQTVPKTQFDVVYEERLKLSSENAGLKGKVEELEGVTKENSKTIKSQTANIEVRDKNYNALTSAINVVLEQIRRVSSSEAIKRLPYDHRLEIYNNLNLMGGLGVFSKQQSAFENMLITLNIEHKEE